MRSRPAPAAPCAPPAPRVGSLQAPGRSERGCVLHGRTNPRARPSAAARGRRASTATRLAPRRAQPWWWRARRRWGRRRRGRGRCQARRRPATTCAPALSRLAFCAQECVVVGLSGLRVLCLGAHGLRRIVRRPGHVLHLRACQRNHHRPCCCLARLPRLPGLLATFLPSVGPPKLNLLTVFWVAGWLGDVPLPGSCGRHIRRRRCGPISLDGREGEGGLSVYVQRGRKCNRKIAFTKQCFWTPLGFCTCVSVLLATPSSDSSRAALARVSVPPRRGCSSTPPGSGTPRRADPSPHSRCCTPPQSR